MVEVKWRSEVVDKVDPAYTGLRDTKGHGEQGHASSDNVRLWRKVVRIREDDAE